MTESLQKIVLAGVAVIGCLVGVWQYLDKRADAAVSDAIQRGEDRAMLRELTGVSKDLRTTLSGYQQLLEDARIRLANLEAYNRIHGERKLP